MLFIEKVHRISLIFISCILLVNYIKNTDGYLGCYCGFAPKITGQVISTLVADSITKNIEVVGGFDPGEDEVDNSLRYAYCLFF